MPLPVIQNSSDNRTQTTHQIKNVIAVAAGKGGVGKSTVAVNLALCLNELGYKVGLLDADLYGPSIRKMLPEVQLPAQKNERLEPGISFGIKVISMAFFRREGQPAAVRAPIANKILTQFIRDVAWGDLDYLIVDFPPGTGDIQLTLAQNAQITAALMVTTPQEVALLDVRKAATLFQQVDIPLLGVIENMSWYQGEKHSEKSYPFGQEGGKRFAAEYNIPLLGEIPIDPAISYRADRGFSIFIEDGTPVPAAQAFKQATQNLLQALTKLKERPPSIKVEKIYLKTPAECCIEWNDGKKHTLSFSSIQSRCPCAQCAEKKPVIQKDIGVHKVDSVGKYALHFEFTAGCSHGIYEFDMLYRLGEEP